MSSTQQIREAAESNLHSGMMFTLQHGDDLPIVIKEASDMLTRLVTTSIGLPLQDSSLKTISRVVFTPGELGGLTIPCPRRALLQRQTSLTLANARSTHPWVQAATHLGFIPPHPNIIPTPPAAHRLQHIASAGLTFRMTPSPSSLPPPPTPSPAQSEAVALMIHHARAIIPCSTLAYRLSFRTDNLDIHPIVDLTTNSVDCQLQGPPLQPPSINRTQSNLFTTLTSAWTALLATAEATGILALKLDDILPAPEISKTEPLSKNQPSDYPAHRLTHPTSISRSLVLGHLLRPPPSPPPPTPRPKYSESQSPVPRCLTEWADSIHPNTSHIFNNTHRLITDGSLLPNPPATPLASTYATRTNPTFNPPLPEGFPQNTIPHTTWKNVLSNIQSSHDNTLRHLSTSSDTPDGDPIVCFWIYWFDPPYLAESPGWYLTWAHLLDATTLEVQPFFVEDQSQNNENDSEETSSKPLHITPSNIPLTCPPIKPLNNPTPQMTFNIFYLKEKKTGSSLIWWPAHPTQQPPPPLPPHRQNGSPRLTAWPPPPPLRNYIRWTHSSNPPSHTLSKPATSSTQNGNPYAHASNSNRTRKNMATALPS